MNDIDLSPEANDEIKLNKDGLPFITIEDLAPKDDLGYSFEERFQNRYNISFSIPIETLTMVLWFKKKDKLINSFLQLGATWVADWFDILQDNGFEVSKTTLSRLLRRMKREKLIGLYVFKPKSRQMNLTKVYYDFDQREAARDIISELEEMDEYYFQKHPPKVPKTEEERIKIAEKNGEIMSKGYENRRRKKVKEQIEASLCEHRSKQFECTDIRCKNSRYPSKNRRNFGLNN